MHCGTDCLSAPFYHFPLLLSLFVCLFVSFFLPVCLFTADRNGMEPKEKIFEREKEEEEDDDDEMKRNHLRRSLPLYCFHYVNKTRGHLSGSCQRTRDLETRETHSARRSIK